jgi:hypothetical protein
VARFEQVCRCGKPAKTCASHDDFIRAQGVLRFMEILSAFHAAG